MHVWNPYQSISTFVTLDPRGATSRFRPPIHIIEPNDVVLPQMITALHFDHGQTHHARIFQPVRMATWNVGRFVGRQQGLVIAVDHPRGSAHHDPMLRTMMMGLKAEPGAGFHLDSLDFETLALF